MINKHLISLETINILRRGVNYFIRKRKESILSRKWDSNNDYFLKKNYAKLMAFKNKHKDQACFVIGNGPSLNQMDLNKLKGSVTIACNSFYLKHKELNFTPTYYTVEDPLPAIDNQKEINAINGVIKFIPYDLKDVIIPDKDVIYLNFLRSYMFSTRKKFPLFSSEVEKKIYWGGTVAYMNIQLAHFLGCNPIYLIGVDLNYHIPSNIKRKGNVLTSTSNDPNHFHPDYFGEGKKWHLPKTEIMQKSFSKANIFLNKNKIKLLNATLGGNLKDIQRINYISIFKKNN